MLVNLVEVERLSIASRYLNTLPKKLIYLIIKDQSKGNWVEIPLSEFKTLTYCDIKTIRKIINNLIDLGLVEKKSQSGKSNSYRAIEQY